MAASPARPWCLKSGSAAGGLGVCPHHGRTMVLLPPAQDQQKESVKESTGQEHGGHGRLCPCPPAFDADGRRVRAGASKPPEGVKGARHRPYPRASSMPGLIASPLMASKVIEFNCRIGHDPEMSRP